MNRLAIIGSALGGGAAQVIEALVHQDNLRAVFILDRDVNAIGKEIHNVPVVGSTDELLQRWNDSEFDVAIIAIGGNLTERKRLFEYLHLNNIPFTNIIDSSVKLGLNVMLGEGNVILNNSYLGNDVKLGNNNYILNQCSIQHNTVIEDHNYFATNVTVGAKVKIGKMNRLGIKSIVETGAIIENEQNLKSGNIYAHIIKL
jgi:NDP-sugar pyrophosphorylase family protein